MSTERLLNGVIQYYQDVHDAAKTDQILGSTLHLLTELSNPLNLGVLTSQLLTAPAIWHHPGGIRNSTRVLSLYGTAAQGIRIYEKDWREKGEELKGGGLRCDEWARAVAKGADDRSRRWQHLLVLTGVLLGMEGGNRRSLSHGLRNTLESAVVTAANLALETQLADGPVAGASIIVALIYAFPLLSDYHKQLLNCNALLPLAVWAITAEEGFSNGEFLLAISNELAESPTHQIAWSRMSPSFLHIQELQKRPIMANMGPLSKLTGFIVQRAADTRLVFQAQDTLLAFTRKVLDAWQKNRLSEIDPAAEQIALTPDTRGTTWQALWTLLKNLMFGVVALLQAIVSRSLLDPLMLNDAAAASTAAKSLHILRNLSFVSSRDGNNVFQVYAFTYLTSIDVISRYSPAAYSFLHETRPAENGPVFTTHLQRTMDLFYLNLAEHLPLTLSTEACEALIIKPATTYISHEGTMTPSMVELFEAAHSAILSTLSCPQHSPLTIQITPFYIVKLFESFPQQISARQFRVAFKTVMQIVSPPFPIADMEPHLSETLLEMLRSNISTAPSNPLPPTPDAASRAGLESQREEPLSHQSALTLALVDSLPFLPLLLVEEWLTITAKAMNEIADPVLREPVKKRFLEILVSGEMDVERAAIGVAWWGTHGGQHMVLSGRVQPQLTMMSGALGPDRTSRL